MNTAHAKHMIAWYDTYGLLTCLVVILSVCSVVSASEKVYSETACAVHSADSFRYTKGTFTKFQMKLPRSGISRAFFLAKVDTAVVAVMLTAKRVLLFSVI